jgi:hypothetical protein
VAAEAAEAAAWAAEAARAMRAAAWAVGAEADQVLIAAVDIWVGAVSVGSDL